MKTIICSSYIQPALYHQLANGSGGVSDVRLIPLGALFPHVEEGDANALLYYGARSLLLFDGAGGIAIPVQKPDCRHGGEGYGSDRLRLAAVYD